MKESDVEKYLHQAVKQLGGTTRKWVSPGHAGVPDRICFIPPMMIWFVEVKTDIGRLSTRQEREIQTLESFGCNVTVVKGFVGVDAFIEEVMQMQKALKFGWLGKEFNK